MVDIRVIQNALGKIGAVAQQKFGQAVDTVSNYRTAPQNPTLGQATQNAWKNNLFQQMASAPKTPVGNVVRPFGQAAGGVFSGLSFGTVNPVTAKPQNRIEQGANIGGNVMGMFNPVGFGAKVLTPVGMGVERAVTSGLVRKGISNGLVRKVAPVLAGEVAQTGAMLGLRSTAGQQFNPTEDLAYGVGMRGALGGAGKLLKGLSGYSPKAFDIHPDDQAVMKDFVNRIQSGGAQMNLGKHGLDIQRLADHYVGKKAKDLSNTQLAKVFDSLLSNAAIRRGEDAIQTPFPKMGIVGDGQAGRPRVIDTKKDFQEMVIAGQDLSKEIGKKVNVDGTITLYHGTSKQNADKILKGGVFNEGGYFSVNKNGTQYGDSPLDVAKRKFGKDATVIEIKVDARGLESAAAGSEVFSPKQLTKNERGIWSIAGDAPIGSGNININNLPKGDASKVKGMGLVGDAKPPAGKIRLKPTVLPQAAIKLKVKGELNPATPPVSVLDDIKKGFEGGRNVKKPDVRGGIGLQARTQLVDRLSPVYDFLKQGKLENTTADKNPYRQMRLLAGVSGKVEAFLNKNVAPILKQEVKRQDDLSALVVLERERELIGQGLKRKRTIEQVNQGLTELQTKYGAEGFTTLQKSADNTRQVYRNLKQQLVDSGIISKEAGDAMDQKGQYYVAFEAVSHMADNLEKGRFGSGSFNVASQDVVKRIGDYIGDVADPLESLVKKTPKIIALVEKNRAMQSFVNLRKQYPEIYKDLIVPIKEGSIKNKGIINVFENGQNVRYSVPEVVESAIKNLDSQTAGLLGTLGKWQANVLRTGATALNIGFIPVNIIRDVQDALTTELSEKGAKAMFKFLASYPRAIMAAARRDDLYKQWAESGGLQSSMMEQILKRPTKTVADLSGKRQIFKAIISSPRNLIEFANRVGEQSTRLARFKSGVAAGESQVEAAFKSRDISLDFAKAGNSIKVLNTIIPFLNAGIQGSEKMIRMYKNNPVAATLSTGIVFGTPAVLLNMHNSQFQDYQDIPDSEKQINWIIIARDRTPEEIAKGEKIIGFKIPKGFIGRITANGVESSMDFARQRDPQAFAKAMYGIAEGVSPVGLPIDGESLRKTAGQVLPPVAKAVIEGTTNKNLFFGSDIVPQGLQDMPPSEQYRENTPNIYKVAGKLTGQSPLIMENTVNTTTGGLGRQIATGLSGDLEGATTKQVTRRFTDIRGGKLTDQAYDTVGKEKQYSALRNKQLKEAYRNGNTAEFERLSQGMTGKQVKSLIMNDYEKEQDKQLSPVQRAYEGLSKEERMRLGNERPELKSDLGLIEEAGAAGKAPDYSTRLKNEVDESMVKTRVEMSGKPEIYNDKYYYVNENGNSASIDMDFTVEKPDLTGQETLDKKLKSKYQGEITAKQNNIVKLFEIDVLTAKEAQEALAKLEGQRNAVGTGKKLNTTKIKAPKKLKLAKPKKLKIKKVKLVNIKLQPQGAKNANKVQLKF